MSGGLIRPICVFRRFCSSGPSVVSSVKENTFVPRQSFDLPASFDKKSWYPMHMAVQLKRMEGKLRTVDLVVEVHDARVAITGRNPVFAKQLYAIRPHILVLNKKDLIDLVKYRQPIEDYYRRQGIEHVIWTNCKDNMSRNAAIKNLQEVIKDHLQNMQRFNRTVKTEYQIMVVGIPNVGKSSLINTLRFSNIKKGKAVEEGSRPGVTVRVQNRVRLLDKPPIYVLDTPGILYPHFDDVDSGMKLALCNLILESATKPHYVADYLLYSLNKNKDYSYVKQVGLQEPTNDIWKVLAQICKNHNMVRNVMLGDHYEDRWNFDGATDKFIKLYRKNLLDDCFLDRDLL